MTSQFLMNERFLGALDQFQHRWLKVNQTNSSRIIIHKSIFLLQTSSQWGFSIRQVSALQFDQHGVLPLWTNQRAAPTVAWTTGAGRLFCGRTPSSRVDYEVHRGGAGAGTCAAASSAAAILSCAGTRITPELAIRRERISPAESKQHFNLIHEWGNISCS